MDRRNGGDPLAPPRPPKSLPRVHRPRAPEPAIMSSAADTTSTANRSLSNVPPQLSPKPRNLSSSSSSTTTTTPAAPRSSSNISSSIPPPLPPQIVPLTPLHTRSQHHNHHQQHLLPSSHNNSSSHSLVQPASTFSRRRPPAALPSLSVAVSSSNNSNILGPPSLETSLPPAATSPVTLAAPRPENERLTNEYVDTPFSNSRLSPPSSNRVPRSAASPGSAVAAPHGEDPTSRQLSSVSPHSPSSNSSSTTGKPIGSTAMPTTLHGSGRNFNNNTINTRPNQLPLGQQHRTVGAAAAVAATPLSAGGSPTIQSATLPITKQPVSNHTFSKDAAATATAGLHELDCIELHPSTNGDLLNSITCPHCKKCRCEECQRPRQLPSRWLCDNSCLCSAETIIDYASCLCVVKALYYHCSKDHEMERESDTISCAEDPCSCLPHKRTTRWGLLGALSLGLPCLWCYWPMRGCVAVCAKCYAKHSRHGCRCQLQNGAGSLAGSILGGPGQSANGTAGPDHAKFSAVTGTSPVFGIKAKHHHHSSHHHHHHHHSDLTPEKRLLDSSPEY